VLDDLARTHARPWRPSIVRNGSPGAPSRPAPALSIGALVLITGDDAAEPTQVLDDVYLAALKRGFPTCRALVIATHPRPWLDVYQQWLMGLLEPFGPDLRAALARWEQLGLSKEECRVLEALITGQPILIGPQPEAASPVKGYETRASQLAEACLRALLRALANDRPVALVLEGFSEWDENLRHVLERWGCFAAEHRVLLAMSAPPMPASQSLPSGVICLPLEPLAYQRLAPQGRARILSLPPSQQNLLAVLAGLGDGAREADLLAIAAPSWEPRQNLDALLEAGLVRRFDSAPDRLKTVPPSLRQAVYDQMPERTKQTVHRRIATYLAERAESGAEVASVDRFSLCRHYTFLGEFDEALPLFIAVLEDFRRSGDADHGVELFETMVDSLMATVTAAPETLASLYLLHARDLSSQQRYREATAFLKKLDSLALSASKKLELRLENLAFWMRVERPEQLEPMVDAVIASLRATSPEETGPLAYAALTARTLYMQALILEHTPRADTAAPRARSAITYIENNLEAGILSATPWGPALYWEPLVHLGKLEMKERRFAQAEAALSKARQFCVSQNAVQGMIATASYLAELLLRQGSPRDAEEVLTQTMSHARAAGNLVALAALHYERGHILKHQPPRRGQAREAFMESLKLALDLDWQPGVERALRGMEAVDGSVASL
jgi:tetratricopeptide (TPR) repeat protein